MRLGSALCVGLGEYPHVGLLGDTREESLRGGEAVEGHAVLARDRASQPLDLCGKCGKGRGELDLWNTRTT